MRYVGGKSKIAKVIVGTIRGYSPYATIAVEPFMGGGAVTAELAQAFPVVLASDAHPDVVALWSAVCGGWYPPSVVTEDEYYARVRAEGESSALRGFVGFGCSFGGKWWGGYARGGKPDGTPRNYAGESARAVERIGERLRSGNVLVRHMDYRDAPVIPGQVIYCDPPYVGTQGYSTGEFDSDAFWAWADDASRVADVYVSEYDAPPGWRVVWSSEKRQSVSLPSQGRDVRVERLFARNPMIRVTGA